MLPSWHGAVWAVTREKVKYWGEVSRTAQRDNDRNSSPNEPLKQVQLTMDWTRVTGGNSFSSTDLGLLQKGPC
jgi:hypothetical protein